MRLLRHIFSTAGDAGWILIGFVTWAITLGAAEVTVSNNLTHNSMHFPGWWK